MYESLPSESALHHEFFSKVHFRVPEASLPYKVFYYIIRSCFETRIARVVFGRWSPSTNGPGATSSRPGLDDIKFSSAGRQAMIVPLKEGMEVPFLSLTQSERGVRVAQNFKQNFNKASWLYPESESFHGFQTSVRDQIRQDLLHITLKEWSKDKVITEGCRQRKNPTQLPLSQLHIPETEKKKKKKTICLRLRAMLLTTHIIHRKKNSG